MKKGLQDHEELDALRKKLYARDSAADAIERHGLSDSPVEVSRNWDIPRKPNAQSPVVDREPEPQPTPVETEAVIPTAEQPIAEEPSDQDDSTTPKPRRRY